MDSYLDIGLNSYPGTNEVLINKWVEENKPKKPFFIKVQYGNDVGNTSSGKKFKGAVIYIVNPLKKVGILWWKKVRLHFLYETDWTLFKTDSKPLKEVDLQKLKNVLQ